VVILVEEKSKKNIRNSTCTQSTPNAQLISIAKNDTLDEFIGKSILICGDLRIFASYRQA
jgi:hypothetical protein